MVRAKFYCGRVEKMIRDRSKPEAERYLYNFAFTPVIGDSEENKKFFAATPSGSIMLNALVGDLFEVGKEYYIDFTPAEKAG